MIHMNLKLMTTLILPTKEQPHSTLPDDDNVEEIYSNFKDDYQLPTTRQWSQPVQTTPLDTNFDSATEHTSPSTPAQPIHTSTTSLPEQATEDRPNSSLPKCLNNHKRPPPSINRAHQSRQTNQVTPKISQGRHHLHSNGHQPEDQHGTPCHHQQQKVLQSYHATPRKVW